ncbi:regulator of cell morphogenesis and NO signaling [Cytobacillus oceanisediminis]|uniref:Regulator of cell morphogenesis and NO signaling n=1 Tax=Cytobacillus oceanisediminis TaxID=665099 RepID=A0A2V2ZTI7_9BACI|nr:iron-sulfur cluster repair di-iron protein [Cytobacillus oceanisediminis]PWW27713.1 regulator of cell morphogenesis and NO signaling [Cytobacillus oceanisediminis]
MTIQLTEDRLVKDIVNEFPKTSDVFKRHRIDFCCGGNIPLLRAAAEQSADIRVLLKELNEVIQKEKPKDDLKVWTESTSEDIIEHVINQYHRPLEEELSLLSPYVTKVARVHGGSHKELLRVHELFFELKKELLEHTSKEEESVFPLLLKLEDPAAENREEIISYIQELEKEHDHAGAILKELRDITSDFAPPADACGSYRLVYKRLEDLEGQTFMHVHLENNILFPRYI